MADRILVLYGSYRSDRMGIRLADFLITRLRARGNEVELIDALRASRTIFPGGPKLRDHSGRAAALRIRRAHG
jgi:NAD(P)H-dependent FMN reductase